MLRGESFGLQMETEAETAGKIALTMGLVGVPPGVCQIFVSSFIFFPVKRKIGELPLLIFAGMSSASLYLVIGFCVREVWQLVLAKSLQGICLGFLLPLTSPLVARYSSANYRSRLAECQAVPLFGGQIASIFGQNLMAFLDDRFGLLYCWIVCSLCLATFIVMISTAYVMAERRAPQPTVLTSEQRKVLLQANAHHPPQDIDAFIESTCQYVRETLNSRRDELWNGTAQFLYRNSVEQGLRSKFREWRDESEGKEYLADMYGILQFYPAELEDFCNKFPHIAETNEFGNSSATLQSVGNTFVSGFPLESASFSLSRQNLHGSFRSRRMFQTAGSDFLRGSSQAELAQPLASRSSFKHVVHRQRTH